MRALDSICQARSGFRRRLQQLEPHRELCGPLGRVLSLFARDGGMNKGRGETFRVPIPEMEVVMNDGLHGINFLATFCWTRLCCFQCLQLTPENRTLRA